MFRMISHKIDETDRHILRGLQADGRMCRKRSATSSGIATASLAVIDSFLTGRLTRVPAWPRVKARSRRTGPGAICPDDQGRRGVCHVSLQFAGNPVLWTGFGAGSLVIGGEDSSCGGTGAVAARARPARQDQTSRTRAEKGPAPA